ncbi:MAG: hypothetical protein H7Z76_13315 [Methylotenera sp.]|nr:hypothetical protein [Flavobacterium sp.]
MKNNRKLINNFVKVCGLMFRLDYFYGQFQGGNFWNGFGLSAGVGVSATAVDFNLNYGTTSRTTPWRN